jgi:transposase-like protein
MTGRSWRVDETYVKIRGQWVYLYRAVDRDGNTVDFRLSRKRDVAAAKAFFRKALKTQGRAPLSITLDDYAASHRAVREMPDEDAIWKDTKLRSSKYLNNMIEQDHRGVKSRIAPMLDFKIFKRAAVTIAGLELLYRIRKGQFDLGRLGDNQEHAGDRDGPKITPTPALAHGDVEQCFGQQQGCGHRRAIRPGQPVGRLEGDGQEQSERNHDPVHERHVNLTILRVKCLADGSGANLRLDLTRKSPQSTRIQEIQDLHQSPHALVIPRQSTLKDRAGRGEAAAQAISMPRRSRSFSQSPEHRRPI